MMKAITALPSDYSKQTVLQPSKNPRFLIGAVIVGILSLIITGWLLVQFITIVRPIALDAILFRDMLTVTPTGMSIQLHPALIRNIGIAVISVLIIHELVHGVFYWWFSGKQPNFSFHGIVLYVAAPSRVYFPRNQFLIVGMAPLVLLTLTAVPLMVIVPVAVAPILLLFVAFNVAGAAGDLLIAAQLLTFSSDVMMEDNGTSLNVYGSERRRPSRDF